METVAERKKRVSRIVRLLRKSYPDVRLALEFATPLDLLIALILAAQCTDIRVNHVTAVLFRQLIQLHGRTTCASRKPKCDACVIEKHCPRVGV